MDGVIRFERSRASKTCVPKLVLGNEVRGYLLGTALFEALLRSSREGASIGTCLSGRRDPLRAKRSFEDLRSQAGAWERDARLELGNEMR